MSKYTLEELVGLQSEAYRALKGVEESIKKLELTSQIYLYGGVITEKLEPNPYEMDNKYLRETITTEFSINKFEVHLIMLNRIKDFDIAFAKACRFEVVDISRSLSKELEHAMVFIKPCRNILDKYIKAVEAGIL